MFDHRHIASLMIVAVASGCQSCGPLVKRQSELNCPTDIRKTVPWCAGEDAIFRCPCGPEGGFYGHKPTCWRVWPMPASVWRDASCGPTAASVIETVAPFADGTVTPLPPVPDELPPAEAGQTVPEVLPSAPTLPELPGAQTPRKTPLAGSGKKAPVFGKAPARAGRFQPAAAASVSKASSKSAPAIAPPPSPVARTSVALSRPRGSGLTQVTREIPGVSTAPKTAESTELTVLKVSAAPEEGHLKSATIAPYPSVVGPGFEFVR